MPQILDKNLEPPLLVKLRHPDIERAIQIGGSRHPYPVLSRAWGDFRASLQKVVDVQQAMRTASSASARHEWHRTLADEMRTALYRSAELVEHIGHKPAEVFKAMGVERPVKPSRSLDRALSEQCNAIKHDGDRLGLFRARQMYIEVHGYQLQGVVGGVLKGRLPMHEKRRAFSYNVELRRLFAFSLLAMAEVDNVLGPLLSSSESNAADVNAHNKRLLDSVLGLELYGFTWESAKHMPVIERQPDGTVSAAMSGGTVLSLPNRDTSFEGVFTADGMTRSFEFIRP